MLKFLSGSILNENEKPVQAVALFLNHTPVAHADVAKSLEMVVEHAGFCHITESKFLQFYGKSISLRKDIEGLDVLALNRFVKENLIYEDYFVYWNDEREIYLVLPKGEEPDYSLNFDTDTEHTFDIFIERIEEKFKERFSA